MAKIILLLDIAHTTYKKLMTYMYFIEHAIQRVTTVPVNFIMWIFYRYCNTTSCQFYVRNTYNEFYSIRTILCISCSIKDCQSMNKNIWFTDTWTWIAIACSAYLFPNFSHKKASGSWKNRRVKLAWATLQGFY